MIRRHSLSAVCMHWFNAFCWIALLFTGFALLSNPAMQPGGHVVGRSLDRRVRRVRTARLPPADRFGVARGLLPLHHFRVAPRRSPLPQGSIQSSPRLRHDLVRPSRVCVSSLGKRPCAGMGLDPALPPQGSTTPGRSSPAVAAVLCSVGLALSGLFLAALALHLVAPAPRTPPSGPCSSICSARA